MKLLAGLLAFISSFFAEDSLTTQPLPLNNATIAFHETYFAPAVAEPRNFPFTKTAKVAVIEKPAVVAPPPVYIPPTPPPPPPSVVAPPPPPQTTADIYLISPEPITDWLKTNITFIDWTEGERTLPVSFDREYWRIEIFAYWAPSVIPKPAIEKDYFKLEVYEEGSNKLIYTFTSSLDDSPHKFQTFKKPGKYYVKTYLKSPSRYELNFTVSQKMAQ